MSSGLSDDRLKNIDHFFQEKYIDTGRLSGALTLVARRGEVAHFSPLGNMDHEHQRPTKKDTIYRIFSMTKAITSVALMMLYEEGQFQLNDPIHKFLPEWKNTEVWISGYHPNFKTRPAERSITFTDLLSHQSGLTYGIGYIGNDHPVDKAYQQFIRPDVFDGSLSKWFKTLSEFPLAFSPGAAWNYSVSTDMCGYLVEVISGKSLDNFFKERIIDPLEMTDTGFTVPEEKLNRFAALYKATSENSFELMEDMETMTYREKPTFLSGGGGLVSTAPDYYKFLEMLLRGGTVAGHQYLSRKTIELMTTNHLPNGKSLGEHALPKRWSETAFDGVGFGLGFSVLMNPNDSQIVGSPGHYAWGGAASTAFWVDPIEEIIVIFMTQLMPSSFYPIRRELQVLVNSAIEN